MDFQTGLVCMFLAMISGAILILISMFGIQEKTYEEAIAEQRNLPNNALLLGKSSKDKDKDKKQKRQGKKAKEKPTRSKVISKKEKPKSTSPKKTDLESVHKENGHVNFVTPEAKVLNDAQHVQLDDKRKKKKDKIKPILINKEESQIVKSKPPQRDVTVNHFTEIIPKDDLQLKLATSKNNQASSKTQSVSVQATDFVEKGKEKLVSKEMNKAKLDSGKNKKAETKMENDKNNKNTIKIKNENTIEKNKKNNNNKLPSNQNVKNESINDKNTKKNEGKAESDNGKKGDSKIVKEAEKVKKVESKVEVDKNKKNEVKVLNNSNKVIKNEQQQQLPASPQKQQNLNQSQAERTPSDGSVNGSPVKMNNKQSVNNKDSKSKSKKKDGPSLQQMTDRDSVNIQLLIPMIRKAELSRTEVQILTDLLLNKHLDEVSDHFEWVEGRQDPVFKLKKQLAEKEKALAEEQEASQAFQNKLKELRTEFNGERARLTQACRQYEETVMAKQGEIQNLHAANRHMVDTHVAEKQALSQKIQQLQAQVNDDNMVIRKLQEDHNQTQNALQQELVNQRQQMEMHIGRLSEQLQESQKNLEVQIHAKIQEAEQIRASFNAELQKNRMCEDEVRELREQHIQSQNKIKSLEARASQLKESNSHTQELARQIEDLQRANKDLEKRLNASIKFEEELQFEKSKLQNEVHGFTNKVSELQGECEELTMEREKLLAQIASKLDLEKDLMRIKEENHNLMSQVASFTKIEREAQQLREENENLAAQVTAFTERPAADGRENGDSSYNEDKKNINVEFINHENETKQKDVVIEKLADELKEKEMIVEKLNTELKGCQSEMSRLFSEVTKYKTEVPKLREELEAQRNKNNDLRQKNWKAMEALTATEKSLENKVKETEKLAKDRLKQEQQASKNLLERLFPNIKVEEKAYEDWLQKFETSAKNYLEEMKSASEKTASSSPQVDASYVEELENKNSQLQGLVVHYKTIIEDTEGMLNKLQKHVEQEEIRWRQKCEGLEPQIQSLKDTLAIVENHNEELKAKVKDLEEKLADKENLDEGCTREEDSESLEKCKKLLEENSALSSKLEEEQEKMKELNRELVRLKSTVKFGQDAYVEENKKRLEIEEELKLLKSKNSVRDAQINSSADLVASEGGGYERM